MGRLALAIALTALVPGLAHAGTKDYFGLPSVPEGEIVSRTETRIELRTELSHDEALEYFRHLTEEYENIKFRNWSDSTYIEDNGALTWHSITISKEKTDGMTTVVIAKDNWTWIIGTLILRFFGVFMVLIVLLGAMSISGAVISWSLKRLEKKDGDGPPDDDDGEIAAVIAAAKKFENK